MRYRIRITTHVEAGGRWQRRHLGPVAGAYKRRDIVGVSCLGGGIECGVDVTVPTWASQHEPDVL